MSCAVANRVWSIILRRLLTIGGHKFTKIWQITATNLSSIWQTFWEDKVEGVQSRWLMCMRLWWPNQRASSCIKAAEQEVLVAVSTIKSYIQHCNMSVEGRTCSRRQQLTVQLSSYSRFKCSFGCGAYIALDVKTAEMHNWIKWPLKKKKKKVVKKNIRFNFWVRVWICQRDKGSTTDRLQLRVCRQCKIFCNSGKNN